MVTLDSGSGTCRDYALFLMEAARSLGFAARFVSGYLYDESLIDGEAAAVVGGGATHAWVQIYLPGAGWVEFNPTNALVGGRNLIRVAVARDPKKAIPAGRVVHRQDRTISLAWRCRCRSRWRASKKTKTSPAARERSMVRSTEGEGIAAARCIVSPKLGAPHSTRRSSQSARIVLADRQPTWVGRLRPGDALAKCGRRQIGLGTFDGRTTALPTTTW